LSFQVFFFFFFITENTASRVADPKQRNHEHQTATR
jgi:hypothetical protein